VLVVLTAVLLLLAAAAVTGVTAVVGRGARSPSAHDALAPIDGYPQRIGFRRPSPTLPDRAGPLAATMFDNDFGGGRDLGVTSRGRLWELPAGINSLSPDGKHLFSGEPGRGYSSRLTVHDLTTGERRVFDDIGQSFDAREARRFRYLIDPSAVVDWSQDGSAVLTQVGQRPRRHRHEPMVLDLTTGTLTPVAGTDTAGFRSPSEAVTVSKVGGKNAKAGIVATTTDLETGASQDLSLELISPWRGDPDSRLVASVSPDGEILLLVEVADGAASHATLRLLSLADGSEDSSREIDNWDAGCALTWLGDDPVVPTKDRVAGSSLVTATETRPLVAVHHRLQSSCLELTPAALEAGPHTALLGTWTYTWTWYWQPVLAFSLALAGLAWLLRRRWRGRG
jgi:hypothetical protein